MKAALAELLHNPLLWQGDRLARAEDAVASGFAALDRELPGGGWPQASLTELLLDYQGIGELRLVLPALKALVRAGAWIALIAPPHVPYPPAPLRIRLSLAEQKLCIDVFKRRGGVMSRPLMLDVSASSVNIKNPISHAMEDVPPATAIVKPMRKIDRLPVHRSASFKSQYP